VIPPGGVHFTIDTDNKIENKSIKMKGLQVFVTICSIILLLSARQENEPIAVIMAIFLLSFCFFMILLQIYLNAILGVSIIFRENFLEYIKNYKKGKIYYKDIKKIAFIPIGKRTKKIEIVYNNHQILSYSTVNNFTSNQLNDILNELEKRMGPKFSQIFRKNRR